MAIFAHFFIKNRKKPLGIFIYKCIGLILLHLALNTGSKRENEPGRNGSPEGVISYGNKHLALQNTLLSLTA